MWKYEQHEEKGGFEKKAKLFFWSTTKGDIYELLMFLYKYIKYTDLDFKLYSTNANSNNEIN